MRIGSTIILFFLCVSCASAPPRFQKIEPSPGEGVLYVYRPNLLTSYFTRTEIAAAGKVQTLESGEYAYWVLPQGQYEVKSHCPDSKQEDLCPAVLEVQVISGEDHYIRFNARGGQDISSEITQTVGRVINEPVENKKIGYLQYVGRPEGRDEIKILKHTEQK